MTPRAFRLYVTLSAIAIAVVLVFAGAIVVSYSGGYGDGMRDLCGEMGGTWSKNEHGEWCDR